MINWPKLISSFKHAFSGLRVAFKEEQSFRIQLFVALVVFVFMFLLPLYFFERIILVLIIGFVLGLELINSQVERVANLVKTDHDPRIKQIKDLSAGAVLVASLSAVVIAIFIFFSHLVK